MIRTMLACATMSAFIVATLPDAAIAADMPATYKPIKAKKAVGTRAAKKAPNTIRSDNFYCRMRFGYAYPAPIACW
jgi:hypothetical protein